MGRDFPITAMIPPQMSDSAQKGYQGMKTMLAVNNLPTTPGPAQPMPPSLTMPVSAGDAFQRVQDAFKAARVMKAARDGNGNQALDALNGR